MRVLYGHSHLELERLAFPAGYHNPRRRPIWSMLRSNLTKLQYMCIVEVSFHIRKHLLFYPAQLSERDVGIGPKNNVR